jgi:hypothetical protein
MIDCEGQSEKQDLVFEAKRESQLSSQSRSSDVRILFPICLRQAEICINLLDLSRVFDLRAPPFFNIAIDLIGLHIIGPTDSEVAKEFSGLPPSLRTSLFPPTKPLNAYGMCRVVQEDIELHALIPRDCTVGADKVYSIKQLLIVNTDRSAHVHGVILRKDLLIVSGTRRSDKVQRESPAKRSSECLKERLRLLAI